MFERTGLATLVVAVAGFLSACGVQPAGHVPEAAHAPAASTAGPEVRAWTQASRVGDVVAAQPESARLFELLEIDYCCGGAQTLGEAAQARGVDAERLIGVLAQARAAGPEPSWVDAPLGELIDHIVATYHVRLRSDLPRLAGIVTKVGQVHGESHPELAEVGRLYARLSSAIAPHLALEEERVFPAILAGAAETRGLLEQMQTEHDDVGGMLHRMRELTLGFAVPEDACVLYTQMMKGLEALEGDLHAHVHLENNVLRPRVLAATPAR